MSAMAQAPVLGLHPAQWLAALPAWCPTIGCAAAVQGLVSLVQGFGAWSGGLGAPWWLAMFAAAAARMLWIGLAVCLGMPGD
ncbi:MAG: hypothetical protein K6U87_06155 [Firmicutes bacterium]|nr:hypothetical protein [Bacillota bacterium]